MKEKVNWLHAMYVFGIIALIIGAFDPLERSVVIVIGSVLIGLSTFLSRDRHWKIFFVSTILIIPGVIAMLYISSIGGFGGKSTLSRWWGILILPYPIGWLISIITLIVRVLKNTKPRVKK